MAERTKPTDYPRVFCILCGWPNVRAGHNAKERQTLRDSAFRDLIRELFLKG